MITHATQLNPFVGARGLNHLISPIGYNLVHKIVGRGANVRSAREQYEIHTYAYEFKSDILKIPKPECLIDSNSYLMEHVPQAYFLDPRAYRTDHPFLHELNRFYHHMISLGYYPHGFTVLNHTNGTYTLLDFSQFGSVQGGMIRFKHLLYPIHILEAEKSYGFVSFLFPDGILIEGDYAETEETEKIEDSVRVEYDPAGL
jgi:hypothetical protein